MDHPPHPDAEIARRLAAQRDADNAIHTRRQVREERVGLIATAVILIVVGYYYVKKEMEKPLSPCEGGRTVNCYGTPDPCGDQIREYERAKFELKYAQWDMDHASMALGQCESPP